MSLDRYLAIVHPVNSRSLRTQRNTVVAVTIMWVVVSSANSPLLSHHDVVYYCFAGQPRSACINVNIYSDTTLSVGRTFYGCFFAFAYVLPLSVISLLYGRLLLHLRHRARRATESALAEFQRRYIISFLVLILCLLQRSTDYTFSVDVMKISILPVEAPDNSLLSLCGLMCRVRCPDVSLCYDSSAASDAQCPILCSIRW